MVQTQGRFETPKKRPNPDEGSNRSKSKKIRDGSSLDAPVALDVN